MASKQVLRVRATASGHLEPRILPGHDELADHARRHADGPAVTVPGIDQGTWIKIATERDEWEQAFELLATSYRGRGYETSGPMPYRFTPYHLLPDTVTLVAKRLDRVVATLTVVPDTSLLGMPMEGSYAEEIGTLRRQGKRLAEAISLADRGLTLREFFHVFQALIRHAMQYHASRGGDSWVIAVNPRHSNFYQKVMGFEPLGPRRAYPAVQHHPSEAYWLSTDRMRSHTPEIFREVFEEPLSRNVLAPPAWSAERMRHFGHHSSQVDAGTVDRLIVQIEHLGSLPRWLEGHGSPESTANEGQG